MDWPRQFSRLFARAPDCGYLEALARVEKFHRELAPEDEAEMPRALVRWLAEPAHLSPTALNFVRDHAIADAEGVLLAHLYDSRFFSDAEADATYPAEVRALVIRALAALNSRRAAPAVEARLMAIATRIARARGVFTTFSDWTAAILTQRRKRTKGEPAEHPELAPLAEALRRMDGAAWERVAPIVERARRLSSGGAGRSVTP